MKLLVPFFALSLMLIFLEASHAQESLCQHDDKNLRCVTYIRNYDGDTVTFNIPHVHPLLGKKINIRVSGVDTPELRTKNKCEKQKARVAKRFVSSFLKKAKRIDLQKIERGKYFRVVADVMVDGESLSEILLRNGLAYSYDGGSKAKVDWCRPQREIASQNKKLK